jgi:hypothetical protein
MVQTLRCAVKLGYVVKHYRSEIFEGAHRASIRHCNLDERFARILEFGKPIAGSRLLAECLEAKGLRIQMEGNQCAWQIHTRRIMIPLSA